jgi:glycosyltransferase involved in cell wall biosynthesis
MVKDRKIIFISDFNLSHSLGGAQRSNEIIIQKGRELGYSILEANFNFNFNVEDFDQYDILISSNLEAIYKLNPNIIDKIANHKYHVSLEHDSNKYLKQEDREKLFRSCKKTVFLTNFHYQFFINNYGDIFNNVEIISDPIDTNLFYNQNKEREDKILYVGFMHELKGSLGFFELVMNNPNIKFVIAGWGTIVFDFLASNLPNIEYLGNVDHTNMPNLFNKYETLYYNPIIPEPFCRSVAEGVLCGIKLMSPNSNIIGCLNELREIGREKFIENCQNASKIFWDKILTQ